MVCHPSFLICDTLATLFCQEQSKQPTSTMIGRATQFIILAIFFILCHLYQIIDGTFETFYGLKSKICMYIHGEEKPIVPTRPVQEAVRLDKARRGGKAHGRVARRRSRRAGKKIDRKDSKTKSKPLPTCELIEPEEFKRYLHKRLIARYNSTPHPDIPHTYL